MRTLSLTLEMLGTVFIAYTALRVHIKLHRNWHINASVLNEIKHEEIVVVVGIIFIVVGYFIQIFFE